MAGFQKNGAAHIRALIAAAKAAGQTEVVLHGDYEIEDTVLLPSHTTLLLADCHLRLAGAMRDCHFEDIYGFDGCPCLIEDRRTEDPS